MNLFLVNFSEINALLHIFSLILCSFFMLYEISCIENDKMFFFLLYFLVGWVLYLIKTCQKKIIKNRVGGWAVNFNLDSVIEHTLFLTLPQNHNNLLCLDHNIFRLIQAHEKFNWVISDFGLCL